MAQITVTFDNYEEMMDFARLLAGAEDSPEPVKKETSDKAIPYGRQIAKDFPDVNAKAEETEDTDTPEPEKEETVVYTLVDVRGKLSELTKAGKKQQVQELIKSFGGDRLSQISEDLYPEVMQKAGEL